VRRGPVSICHSGRIDSYQRAFQRLLGDPVSLAATAKAI
jgi:hypothetical protein